jgi:hypothetical protein
VYDTAGEPASTEMLYNRTKNMSKAMSLKNISLCCCTLIITKTKHQGLWGRGSSPFSKSPTKKRKLFNTVFSGLKFGSQINELVGVCV